MKGILMKSSSWNVSSVYENVIKLLASSTALEGSSKVKTLLLYNPNIFLRSLYCFISCKCCPRFTQLFSLLLTFWYSIYPYFTRLIKPALWLFLYGKTEQLGKDIAFWVFTNFIHWFYLFWKCIAKTVSSILDKF